MRHILKKTWEVMKYNIRSVFLFEAGYRIVTFFLIMQLVHTTVEFSLEQQNFSYLTAENYLKFLASPLSLLFLFLTLLLILLFFLIEISALLSCFRYSYQKKKMYVSDMMLEGVRRTFSFLRYSKGSWILCAVFSAPFLAAYSIVWEISYIQILEFTARQIYKAVKPTACIYIGIGILLFVSLLFAFALPYCILEKEKGTLGIPKGVRLLKRQWKNVLSGFLILHGAMLLFLAGVYFFLMFLMCAGVSAWKPDAGKISAVLVYSDYINMWFGIFVGAVQVVCSVAFVYAVYSRFHVQPVEEIPLYARMKSYFWFSKIGRKRIAVFFTLLLFTAEGLYLGGTAMQNAAVFDTMVSETEITAHRGGARKAPENTLSSLAYTVECGADFAEIDVQETKDGELILLHDDSFKRTAGVKKKVWEMTLPEVKKLDAGASFHRKFRGEKIPTLEEVLKYCKGKLDLNIEIKYNGKNKGIVHKVVRVIQNNHFEKNCVVTSMNYQFLEQIKKIAPEIRTGYIMTMTYGDISRVDAADFFSVKYTYVDEKFVRNAHTLGKEVHAWTVNYRGDAKRMFDVGVDNIITDDPVLVRKVQNQKSGAGTEFSELLKYAFRI